MTMSDKDLKHINVSRSLSLQGWNYYEKSGFKYKAISKSRYLEIKKSNKAFSLHRKKIEQELRNS